MEDIGLEEMADMIAAANTAKEEGASLQEVFSKPREGNPMDSLAKETNADPAKWTFDWRLSFKRPAMAV